MRGVLVGGLLASAACGVSDEGRLPPEVEDPSTLRTPNGAMGLYREAVAQFPATFVGAVTVGGFITDELAALPITLTTLGSVTVLDSRQGLANSSNAFHRLRAQAREARGFLQMYATDSSSALSGHTSALEGYAEIFLADLFCSGIPLSTMNFDGDYTLTAGSTTEEVYAHALALFDTALALSNDSVHFQYLAALGRGRALLGLGRYAEAAVAVAGVPDAYRYDLSIAWNASAFPFAGVNSSIPPAADSLKLIWYWTRNTSNTAANNTLRFGAPSVGNQEGLNGLNYRTSGDPRIQVVAKGKDPAGNDFFMPSKYTRNGTTVSSPIAFMLASGIEARLIEAEGALQAQDYSTWLIKLNHLRRTMWTGIFPAITAPLDSLADPGPDVDGDNDLRANLLFRERAFWLYLTGHRQSDLRRLIRQYNRVRTSVYPTGTYPGGPGQYGDNIVVPTPDEERQLNPRYVGCFHLNA